jgi:NADH:ubiquinone oxidoreductase subunit 3 (subunit A)
MKTIAIAILITVVLVIINYKFKKSKEVKPPIKKKKVNPNLYTSGTDPYKRNKHRK